MKSKMQRKQGLTPEEVSKMLGVSIGTVIRYFDREILTGSKDPITGRMAIDVKSVRALVALSRKRTDTIRKGVDKAVDDFARRRSKGQGLTTVEASRMLGISRFTVAGYFDQGILTGWKNPVTSRMMIARESVETLAKELGIELSE